MKKEFCFLVNKVPTRDINSNNKTRFESLRGKESPKRVFISSRGAVNLVSSGGSLTFDS